jgi:hypothetical protein
MNNPNFTELKSFANANYSIVPNEEYIRGGRRTRRSTRRQTRRHKPRLDFFHVPDYMNAHSPVKVVRRNQPGVVVARGAYRGQNMGIHRVGVQSNMNNPNFTELKSFANANYSIVPNEEYIRGGRRTRRARRGSRKQTRRHKRRV